MAVLAMPAGAEETPTEAPVPAVPLVVTGRNSLVLPLPAQAAPITATVTDERGETATWAVEAPAGDAAETASPYELNLETPDEGTAPVNGAATLTVTGGDATLLDAPLTLDRDPAAPMVAVVNRNGDVSLLWNRVAGPGYVTYRVQRAAGAGEWKTLSGADTQNRFTDEALDPGRYRYRVNAMVPAARAGFNFSDDGVVSVRVVQAAAPAPEAPAEETVDPPATSNEPRARPTPRRDVAATGDIRRPIAERLARRGSPAAPTLQPLRWRPRTQQRIASGPSIAAPRLHADDTPVAAPPLARTLPTPPVALPPAGTLAVDAAAAGSRGLPPISPATWLTAAALAGMLIVSARRRADLSLAADGPR